MKSATRTISEIDFDDVTLSRMLINKARDTGITY